LNLRKRKRGFGGEDLYSYSSGMDIFFFIEAVFDLWSIFGERCEEMRVKIKSVFNSLETEVVEAAVDGTGGRGVEVF
jgi:hypothetical protein